MGWNSDYDYDGLDRPEEWNSGSVLPTSETLPDSDGDGVDDGTEIGDPQDPLDTDDDGIIDAMEMSRVLVKA